MSLSPGTKLAHYEILEFDQFVEHEDNVDFLRILTE